MRAVSRSMCVHVQIQQGLRECQFMVASEWLQENLALCGQKSSVRRVGAQLWVSHRLDCILWQSRFIVDMRRCVYISEFKSTSSCNFYCNVSTQTSNIYAIAKVTFTQNPELTSKLSLLGGLKYFF